MNNIVGFAIGSYTEKLPHVPGACGKGIVVALFNEETGGIEKQYTIEGMNNPSYLTWDNTNQFLYAMTESSEGEGEIQSFSLDSDNVFTLKDNQTGPGRAGCHLNTSDSGDRIFAASYVDGCLKGYPVSNGEIGKPLFNYSYSGSGPNIDRQTSPHAHQVVFSPDNKYLYVCDLGSDKIWKHGLDRKESLCVPALELPRGYGPRHLAFDPLGKYAYILCELIPKLIVASVDGSDGSLTMTEELLTVNESSAEIAAPAAVKVHPSGNTVALSNRFDDTIAVFKINRNTAGKNVSLEFLSRFSSMGKTPRDITFSPSGRWLLIANQDSDDVQVKSFNSQSGYPEEKWAPKMITGTPVCLTFTTL